jgi:hypothetical protein
MGGACSTHVRDEKCIQNYVRKPEGKRPLGSHMCRYKDNIRTDLKEMDGKVWTGWEQESVVESCEDGNEPSVSIKGGEFD